MPAGINIKLTPYDKVGIESDDHGNSVAFLPTRNFSQRNVAVAPLEALGVPNSEALTLTETLRNALIRSDYFNIVSRSDMDKILVEQEFQSTQDCGDNKCLIEMGKILAVEKVVGGSVGRLGETYSITLRMIDVESGKVDLSVLRNVSGKADRLLDAMSSLGSELAGKYASRRQGE